LIGKNGGLPEYVAHCEDALAEVDHLVAAVVEGFTQRRVVVQDGIAQVFHDAYFANVLDLQ